MRLILASASPRRKSILAEHDITYECVPASADERSVEVEGLSPQQTALKLAVFKAQSVYSMLGGVKSDIAVMGADTVVALDGEIFGKPEDEREALNMLMSLRGRSHSVFTAVALVTPQGVISDCEESVVTFPMFEKDFAEKYIKEYRPYDKAGAYGIQELNKLIDIGLEGSYDNVVGLSMKCVDKLMLKAGG